MERVSQFRECCKLIETSGVEHVQVEGDQEMGARSHCLVVMPGSQLNIVAGHSAGVAGAGVVVTIIVVVGLTVATLFIVTITWRRLMVSVLTG